MMIRSRTSRTASPVSLRPSQMAIDNRTVHRADYGVRFRRRQRLGFEGAECDSVFAALTLLANSIIGQFLI
jgi:hypothetical protein